MAGKASYHQQRKGGNYARSMKSFEGREGDKGSVDGVGGRARRGKKGGAAALIRAEGDGLEHSNGVAQARGD